MPRGKRISQPQTSAERLEALEQKIAATENELKDMKATKNELIRAIKAEKLAKLEQMIDASGKSLEEIEAFLQAK